MNNSLNSSEFKGGARPKVRKYPDLKEKCINTKGNVCQESIYSSSFTNNNQNYSADEVCNVSNPLEKKQILIYDNGIEVLKSALSPDWVENRIFIHYSLPPSEKENDGHIEGAIDAWIEQMDYFKEDLSWLLSLPHHKFWSQIVYHKPVQEFLESYLSLGPRWFDAVPRDTTVAQAISEIHSLVFRVFLRSSTYKESKEDNISPETFGQLIYDNYLFDVCKMLDLCSLYSGDNNTHNVSGSSHHDSNSSHRDGNTASLLSKMIQNVFSSQRSYFCDLASAVSAIKEGFAMLEERLIESFEGNRPFGGLASDHLEESVLDSVRDVLSYLLDCVWSLLSMAAVVPETCAVFREQELELCLASFYERVLVFLSDKINSLSLSSVEEGCPAILQDLKKNVDTVRLMIVKLFRLILDYVCFRDGDLSKEVETFCSIMTACLEERIFVQDFNSCYSVAQDILYFQDRGADMTAVQFVDEAVKSVAREVSSEAPVRPSAGPHTPASQGADKSGMNGYCSGESPSGVELESLVASVQDLLPDLGSGFVSRCLSHYNYSTEEVINALLEDKLPPALAALDRSSSLEPTPQNKPEDKGRVSPKSTDSSALNSDSTNPANSELLSSRKNVYDNDQFDLFNNPSDFDQSMAHRGKRDRRSQVPGLDPELKQKMKKISEAYCASAGFSIYDDETKYTPQFGGSCPPGEADYEDEYDDTYDDVQGVDDDTYDQKRSRVPTIFGKGSLNERGLNFDPSESSSGEEDEAHPRLPHSQPSGEARTRNDGGRSTRGNQNSLTFTRGGRGRGRNFRNSASQRDLPSESSSGKSISSDRRLDPAEESGHPPVGRGVPSHRVDPAPFCENPEITRQRYERKRAHQLFKKKGYVPPPSSDVGATGAEQNGARPKTCSKTNKHSGKAWRQGPDEDGNNQSRHGGKYKEDTNHGKAQSQDFRRKMIHKNQEKRSAAQYKYRNNF